VGQGSLDGSGQSTDELGVGRSGLAPCRTRLGVERARRMQFHEGRQQALILGKKGGMRRLTHATRHPRPDAPLRCLSRTKDERRCARTGSGDRQARSKSDGDSGHGHELGARSTPPLKDPKGPLFPVRGDGQTFAVLSHVDQPRLNVDPNSTVRLDVHAEWAECDPWAEFDPSSARRVSQLVRSVTINRGDTTLPELVHEFGDTKHREVTYELTAVSRFRQFFDDEDPEVFLARTPLAPVHVLSSARPAPLQILSTVPAFRWDEDEPAEDWETLERTRLGGRLRIELAGPWHGTGQGEKLGVVVATSGTPPVDLRPFLTQVGRDPIWPGSSVAPISPDPDRWPTHHVFSSAPTGPATKRLAENKKLITVVPHNV